MHESSFFDGVTQVPASVPAGDVAVPAFYRDGEQMTGVFPARLGALRRLLPDRRFSPARIAPGVGAVTVTCFEYRDTDVGVYNELAIAIPLSAPHYRSNFPGRAMLDAIASGQFESWVQHLPVTTELARWTGKEIFNFPKFLADIDFEQRGHVRSCRLAVGGEHVASMQVGTAGGGHVKDIQLFNHLFQNRQTQRMEFKVRNHGMVQSLRPGAAKLELGNDHPIARELRSVLLSRSSIAMAYSPRIEGILYGPDRISVELLPLLLESSRDSAVKLAA